jgi:F0F1-type ATP synthase gamma subunit
MHKATFTGMLTFSSQLWFTGHFCVEILNKINNKQNKQINKKRFPLKNAGCKGSEG